MTARHRPDPESLQAQLRRETRDLHLQLEGHVCFARLMGGDMSGPQYAAFLAAYAEHLIPVAAALEQGLRQSPFQPYIAPACRLAELTQDLQLLQAELQRTVPVQPGSTSAAEPAAWCAAQCPSFLLGALYVHLGSQLGARVISRQLKNCYGIAVHNGGAFFSSTGEIRTSEARTWADFLSVLSTETPSLDRPATVRGARATFTALSSQLSLAN